MSLRTLDAVPFLAGGIHIPNNRPSSPLLPRALLLWLLVVEALIVCLAVGIIPYAHPVADDISFSVQDRDMSMLQWVGLQYREWSGRWAAYAVSHLVFHPFEIAGSYPFLLLVLWAFCAVSLHFLVCSLMEWRMREARSILATATLLILHWTTVPSPGETLYWLCGLVMYPVALAIMMLFLGWFCLACRRRASRSTLGVAALALAAVFVQGLHELYGLQVCIVLFAGTLAAFATRSPSRRVWLVIAVSSAIGFLLSYLAPGNHARAGQYPQAGHMAIALRSSVRMAVGYLYQWGTDVRLLLASLLFVTSARLGGHPPAWLASLPRRWRMAVPLLWLGVVFLTFFGPIWAMGAEAMPYRIVNSNHCVFLLGWFVSICAILPGQQSESQSWTGIRLAALFLFGVSLLGAPNTQKTVSDFHNGRFRAYDQTMRQRYAILRQARLENSPLVTLPRVHDRPNMLYNNYEITPDPAYGMNRQMAKCFHVPAVRLGDLDAASPPRSP